MLSVDFQELEELRFQDDWGGIGRSLAEDALRVEQAGADFLLLCTNTMHMVAAQIEAAIKFPLTYIADPTAEAIKARGLDTSGLLGTKFTMEEDFYVKRLESKFGLKVLIPSEADREIAHNVIYGELVKGVIKEESRQAYLRIMDDLMRRSDIISIHCPLDGNHDLIDFDKLSLMKKSAFIINVSRGGIVNEDDLYKALSEKLIAGAACDVFASEPLKKDNPLLSQDNFIATSHIAWYSEQSCVDLERKVAEEAARGALGEELLNVVNK